MRCTFKTDYMGQKEEGYKTDKKTFTLLFSKNYCFLFGIYKLMYYLCK